MKIREELGNKEGIATSYNNIGYIYQNQGDYQNALKHYELSLKIRTEIDSKYGIAESYNNIGGIYGRMEDHDKALEYYFLSLEIQEEIGDSAGIAISLINIGIFITDKVILIALHPIQWCVCKEES
ncbi:MAG: tetratricopeptide repeat protein [Crocinitomicaceae bacterium]|nr:tetratricopeptide repeat protein [Crocinitomicaceae bacterium]